MTVELAEVVSDLSKVRTTEVGDETEIVDPTISSATHSIEPIRTQLGREVRIRKRVRIEPGDLVFSRLHTQNGAFAYADRNYLATSTFVPLEVDESKVDRRYLFWALHHTVPSMVASDSVGRETYKTREILALRIVLPDRNRQRQYGQLCDRVYGIARRGSDFATQAESDSKLVLAKGREQHFQASPAPRRPLAEVATKRTGFAYKASEFMSEGRVPVVRIKDISTQKPEVFLPSATEPRHVWLEAGDIVLAKTSFSTGTMCIWSGPPAVLNQNAVMLRAKAGLEQRYLFHWLKYQVNAYLAAHLADPDFYPYIRETDLMQWELPLPDESTQMRVAGHLDELASLVERAAKVRERTRNDWLALPDAVLHSVIMRGGN